MPYPNLFGFILKQSSQKLVLWNRTQNIVRKCLLNPQNSRTLRWVLCNVFCGHILVHHKADQSFHPSTSFSYSCFMVGWESSKLSTKSTDHHKFWEDWSQCINKMHVNWSWKSKISFRSLLSHKTRIFSQDIKGSLVCW